MHLLNYSDYPVENVTMRFPAEYKKALLLAPEGAGQALEVSPAGDSSAVAVEKVAVCATIRLEQ